MLYGFNFIFATFVIVKSSIMKRSINDNYICEITPLSNKDCFYIADRHKKEFTYPMHSHKEFELNFVEHSSGVRRVVGDSSEVLGDYDLVLITSPNLLHVWEQNTCLNISSAERYIRTAAAGRATDCRYTGGRACGSGTG